jgi:hypothetical protein
MRNTYVLFLAFAALCCSCREDFQEPIPVPLPVADYPGIFPSTPVNLGDINSSFDDYNSASPIARGSFPLVFSSNRHSSGKDFDFIFKMLSLSRLKVDKTGVITVTEDMTPDRSWAIVDINLSNVLSVNSKADELGPYLVNLGLVYVKNTQGFSTGTNRYAFLFATSQSGNLDIRFTEDATTGTYGTPKDITFLNSSKDDAYPCIMPDTSAIYFCSNRDANFDIYKADLSGSVNGFRNTLQDGSAKTITRDLTLSSDYDDKCPFIFGKLMLFASNRPGGYGGFDLYYSKFVDGKWSAPVNFGDKINTAGDEYRPIIITHANTDFGTFTTNNMMIFSSNRPGGRGGFDLYYVGIEK